MSLLNSPMESSLGWGTTQEKLSARPECSCSSQLQRLRLSSCVGHAEPSCLRRFLFTSNGGAHEKTSRAAGGLRGPVVRYVGFRTVGRREVRRQFSTWHRAEDRGLRQGGRDQRHVRDRVEQA